MYFRRCARPRLEAVATLRVDNSGRRDEHGNREQFFFADAEV